MVTVRDLVDTIEGIQKVARNLRACASSKPVDGMDQPTVLAQANGLYGHAMYLENAATELKTLIPDDEVQVPTD